MARITLMRQPLDFMANPKSKPCGKCSGFICIAAALTSDGGEFVHIPILSVRSIDNDYAITDGDVISAK